MGRVGGEVGAAVVGGGQVPDVAGVLAEGVADGLLAFHGGQALVAVGVGAAPVWGHASAVTAGWAKVGSVGARLPWWRAGASVWRGAAGLRGLADGVEVEVVAGAAGQQVDDLMGAGQAVGDG